MLFHPSAQATEILEILIRRHILRQVCLISSLPEDQGRPGSDANQMTWGARPAFDQVIWLQSQRLGAHRAGVLKSKSLKPRL